MTTSRDALAESPVGRPVSPSATWAERITETALDALEEMFYVFDEEGRFLRWNRSAVAVTGYSDEEIASMRPDEFFVEEDRPHVLEAIARARRRGTATVEARLRTKSGDCIPCEFTGSLLADAYGNPVAICGVGRDVTERKRMEHELARAQKLESIGRLAAGIAHEINTPAQYVGDNTRFLREAFVDMDELLENLRRLLEAVKQGSVSDELVAEVESAVREVDVDYLREEVPKAIQQSLEGIERVANIVRAMKDFSHPGSERKQAVDLNRAIESTLTVCRNEWKYVAELETGFDPNLPPVACLAGDFNQVILNLVVNAAQAIAQVVGDGSTSKGTITVRTRDEGDWAEIRIEDTGAGMPPEIRDKVFDHFFTTKDVGQGTGQGLAIAHSIVARKHGGTIRFETEVGNGTTFIVRLPIEDQAE